MLLLTIIIGGIIGIGFQKLKKLNYSEQKSYTPAEIWNNEVEDKLKSGESKTDKPDEFTKYFKSITTMFSEEDSKYPINYRIEEHNKALLKAKSIKTAQKFTPLWKQRGPANVGGRTRGLIVDPDDPTHETWFAGAATGGIWKTTDGGQTWTCLTDHFPNLSANTLAMAESDRNIIYAGTGESFPGGTYLKGNGVFKSTDKGTNWIQLASTANNEDFAYVNRLVIDPSDADIVVVATEKGIMRTSDGGLSWNKVYESTRGVEDLKADPDNFNNLYAGENSTGILKSTDAGVTWALSSNGISGGERFELAVSPVNSSYVYASQNINSNESYVYRSTDAGANWVRFDDKLGTNQNFLGGQGSYDNTIAAHPYNADIAYLGGVNLWKVDFSDPGTSLESSPIVKEIVLDNISSFMQFVNFGGTYLGGGMELGSENDATNLTDDDFVSVEIRFGTGLSQKAHRFTVGGQGGGVPVSGYIYNDYVDVPFEVWDVTNNKQLMVSFRDQKEDGDFDLNIPAGETSGREYFFINGVDYAESPSADIAINGGHSYKQLYFFWPNLADGATWNESNIPDSKISIEIGNLQLTKGTTSNVSDAYRQFLGGNNYNQSAGVGNTSIPGIHPDHHNLILIPINEPTDSFLVVNANDGGLGISYDSGKTLNQLPNNYITTQFYGVAKRSEKDEYIGGMQDNGTWRSQSGEIASDQSMYLFQIGGDGFECLWHYSDDNRIIGSIYNNAFYKTTDRGSSWGYATTGITSDDGPFITRISSHKNTPNNLYAVGKTGVYKSTDFADTWVMKNVPAGWLPSSYGAVTSQHNVEVSLANENIVWAGAAMASSSGWRIFVSTNQGETFNAVNDFADANMSGFISGIATHPFEDSTAYLLFSFSGQPKVLRTENLGQTWEDITGFVGNSASDNGFPNVVTHSLVVLPNDPNTIWVGTDIGLFESNDNGVSWHYADNGIPAVSIYDMFVQDGQVVVATHGRGIWTATIDEMEFNPELNPVTVEENTLKTTSDITQTYDSILVYVNNNKISVSNSPALGENEFSYDAPSSGEYVFHIIAYVSGTGYRSNNVRKSITHTGIADFANNHELSIYPNPSSGIINIGTDIDLDKSKIEIYSLNGSVVHTEVLRAYNKQVNLQHLKNGTYIVRLTKDNEFYTQKIQIRK